MTTATRTKKKKKWTTGSSARNKQLELRIKLPRKSHALDVLGEENEREMETYEWVCGEVKWLQGEVEVEAVKAVRKEVSKDI